MKRQLVGRVVGVHGLKGELKVFGLVADLDRFRDFAEVGLVDPEKPDEPCQMRKVTAVRVHKGHILLMVEGVKDRDAAEALRRHEVVIPFEQRRELDADEYYLDDLEGLEVVDPEGRSLGRVSRFLEGVGGAGILEVRGGEAALDVPFCEDFVARVDVAAGRVGVTARVRELRFESEGRRKAARRPRRNRAR